MSDRRIVVVMSARPKYDEMISPQEAAKILGITDRTVLRYVANGELRAVRLPGGRLWRIRRRDVEALLSSEAAS